MNENLASLNSMGEHVNEIIADIPNTQNEIKQELFLIRNKQSSKDVNSKNSTTYAHAVSKEKKKNSDDQNVKINDIRAKERTNITRDSDQKRNKDDRFKKRYPGDRDNWSYGGKIQRGSGYSRSEYDKPQFSRYNRWDSKPNFHGHRRNDYSQTHRRRNQYDRQYNYPDYEPRSEKVFDRPYIFPRYENRYENLPYNYPIYYDVRNRGHGREFLLPTSNRFSVLGNY